MVCLPHPDTAELIGAGEASTHWAPSRLEFRDRSVRTYKRDESSIVLPS